MEKFISKLNRRCTTAYFTDNRDAALASCVPVVVIMHRGAPKSMDRAVDKLSSDKLNATSENGGSLLIR